MNWVKIGIIRSDFLKIGDRQETAISAAQIFPYMATSEGNLFSLDYSETRFPFFFISWELCTIVFPLQEILYL